MDQRIREFLLLFLFQVSVVAAQTNNNLDLNALSGLKESIENIPSNWLGSDPCNSGWDGIRCTNSRVTSIILSGIELKGTLSSDIQYLSELDTLDLSYNKGLKGTLPAAIGNLKKLTRLVLVGCSFSGAIPDSIGSLKQLVYLSLNINGFTGTIPDTIGNLSNLHWLDLADNQIGGSIPISSESQFGLDMLLNAEHFHLGNNKLNGTIPAGLFSSRMKLIHLLLDNNQLTGKIPTSLGSVKTLEVVRLDRNQLSGEVPSSITNLTNLSELFLSNNMLNGSLPNLVGINRLTNVDLSNNTFNSSDIPPWFSSLPSLTTLTMENTGLEGPIPVSVFNNLSSLESLILKKNRLSGSLDIGTAYSSRLRVIDLQDNLVSKLEQTEYKPTITLVGNPICDETGASERSYCQIPDDQAVYNYSTPLNNCEPVICKSDMLVSPNCRCAYPYTGTLFSRAASFSDYENSSYYEQILVTLMSTFRSLQLPVDSVSLSDPFKNSMGYLGVKLEVFPSNEERFNRSGASLVAFVLSNQIYKPPPFFDPYVFNGEDYGHFAGENDSNSNNVAIIAGAVAGGCVLLLLALLAGMYAFRQKKRAESAAQLNPFVQWDINKGSGTAPQLKGARWFSFQDLKKCSNNFSETNDVGSGGYGKVYRGMLPTGELVAIKRARQESMQGAAEFKTEIELLSRVHHKNLVSLIGFCFEKGEQILVYEYIANGTLRDSLSGKSGIRLDWMRRLKIALGAARGLAYLHELANPPIIHRDVKSNNILLDNHLNAKVADFGLSKPIVDTERSHVSTQVKGTMGYLDPEYYMTQQLTDKSDVYSFGVLLLEIITSRKPIEQGKYIVREVQRAMDKCKELYNLQGMVDETIMFGTGPKGLEKLVDLALMCVSESGPERPTMAEVVKEIENIMQFAGLNPNSGSASTTETYEDAGKGDGHHPYSNEEFEYSGTGMFPSTKLEPH